MYGNPAFECDGAQIRACSRQLATVVTVTGDLNDANLDRVSQYTKRFVLREKPVVLDLSGVSSATPHIISLLSDVDDACFAVAAAEVVAAARGHGPEGLPDEIVDWLDDSASSVTVPDAVLARKAVARVRENSELQELWGENGSENDWDREMASLLARLAAAAAA